MGWAGYKRAIAADPSGVAAVLGVALPVTPHRATLVPSPVDELANIIENESGWEPGAVNAMSGATGLIQFMPQTAKNLGTTVAALRTMSRGEQAPFVAKYFAAFHGIDKPGDLYTATFFPAAVGQPDDYVIATKDGLMKQVWEQNPLFRSPNDGPIVAGNVRKKGVPKTPRPTDPIAPPPPKTPPPSTKTPGTFDGAGWLILALLFLMDD